MLKYLRKYWIFAILAPLFMIGEVLMDLIQPRMMSTIIDEGVLGMSNNGIGDLKLVIETGLVMIGLVVTGGLCGIMSGVFANICSQRFGNDLRKDTFARIMSLSFEQTDKFSTGSLITRVTNDITQLQNLISMSLRGFVRTFMLVAGGTVCMCMLHMSFGMVIACALPVIIFCVGYFILKANPKFTVLQGKLDNLNNVCQENVSGARVVKAYVQEKHETDRFGVANKELSGTQLNVLLLFSYMTPIMNIILNVSIVAIIKVGGIQVQAGTVTPGNVMAAITYVSQVLHAVMRMSMIFQTASRGYASGKRVMEIIECEPTIKDGPFDGNAVERFSESTFVNNLGKVEFKNVSFAYPNMENESIIEDFSLIINPGETIGILGATGSGKSSLVNLIPRFFDVTGGEVLLDDINVKDYKLSVLRDKVAFALQNSEIFGMSIKENISWGNPDASDEEICHAAEIAQAMEFIQNKQNGMDTPVTQGGTSLSGGQRQRVAISRAVLKKAEVLIFDDATSALDLRTEAQLYEALNREYGNVTKIIIAQRIASVKDADRIVVIDNGRLAALGSHDELIEKSDIYKDIYDSQLRNGGV